MTVISFTVPGTAVPWARTAGGKSGARFTPAKQRSYAGTLKLFCQNAMECPPLAGPVELEIRAVYAWPASWSGRKRAAAGPWKTSRADLSNVVKLVEDALNTVAWLDDAQIVRCEATKVYGVRPELQITIRSLGASQDDLDAHDDLAKSTQQALGLIKQRVAAGGQPWEPK